MKTSSNFKKSFYKIRLKKLFLFSWLTILFAGICLLFWNNELVYSLPTPLPDNYKSVSIGTHIDLAGKLNFSDGKPYLIHFFNPDCPCSKFNMPHFKSLVNQYSDKMNFAIVVINKDKDYTSEEIQNRFGLTVPVLFDKSIAISCGVYSTPQAVILDRNQQLYYRGNYNKSRYCTDAKSDFAQAAIDSLLNNNSNPMFSPLALKAYGCTLPDCKK